jgi:hypothetical protein
VEWLRGAWGHAWALPGKLLTGLPSVGGSGGFRLHPAETKWRRKRESSFANRVHNFLEEYGQLSLKNCHDREKQRHILAAQLIFFYQEREQIAPVPPY